MAFTIHMLSKHCRSLIGLASLMTLVYQSHRVESTLFGQNLDEVTHVTAIFHHSARPVPTVIFVLNIVGHFNGDV